MPYFPDDNSLHASMRMAQPATLPSTFGEYAGASAEAFLKTNRSISRPWMQMQEHEKVMDAYRSATGKQFQWRNKDGVMESVAPAFDGGASMFWKSMQEQIDANPELRTALPVTSHEALKAKMFAEMRLAEGQQAEVGARASGMATAGGFAGSLAAAVTDPPVAASMFIGAGMGVTLLRGAMIEAGVGGGSEAIVQAFLQPQRKEAGLESGLGPALEAIGIASVGGAGIYAVGRLALKALTGAAQQLAFEQIIKKQHFEDGKPSAAMSSLEHQHRMDQAIFDLEEGRAINVDAVPRLQDNAHVIGLEEINTKLEELGRLGLPVDDLVPTLPRAMRAANEGVRIAFARDRVEALTERATQTVGAEQEAVVKARDAEQAHVDALEQRSQVTTEQIRNELARAEGREGARKALDRSTQRRLNQLESMIRDAPDAKAKQDAMAERARILDAARKRVSRETERLARASDAADARLLTTTVQKSEADKALQTAMGARQAAERDIATQIGGALRDSDIRRMYKDRAAGVVEVGPEPPGMAARGAQAIERADTVEAQTVGPMAAALRDDQIANAREVADAFKDSDLELELPDGTVVRASEAWQRVDESESAALELEACIRGG